MVYGGVDARTRTLYGVSSIISLGDMAASTSPPLKPLTRGEGDRGASMMERGRQMDCEVDLVHVPQTYEHTLYPFGKGHPRMSLQAALTLLS